MTDEEWGPWVKHDGKGCPCIGKYGQFVFEDGQIIEGIAGSMGGRSWDWSTSYWRAIIVRYRLKKPKGLTTCENLLKQVEDNPKITELV